MEKRFGSVVFVPGENAGQYPYCHSLYIDGDVKVLIDPASDRDRLLHIRESSGVDVVLLSHWHEDHLMHMDLFEDKEVWISQPDSEPLQSLQNFLDAYGMIGGEREYWTKTMLEVFHFQPRFPGRLIENGQVIDLGGIHMEVIHTPGHTPGHVSLYFHEPEVLFLGDYDLTAFGPWYGDVGSDIDSTIASVNRLRAMQVRTRIASHGKGVFEEEPGELWDRYLAVIDEREQRLLEQLQQPLTMSEIVEARIVYRKKREPKEFFDLGERGLMGKHLQRLITSGLVVVDGDVYRKV